MTTFGTPWSLVEEGHIAARHETAGFVLAGFETGAGAQSSTSGGAGAPSSTSGGADKARSSTSGGERRTATVVLSGDLLWHDTVWHSAAADHARTGRGKSFDFDPMFAALRPMVATADLLERAGVGHVGTFRTLAERRRPVVFTTDQEVRIAVIGGTYSLNGFPPPAGRERSVSMWEARNLIGQARAARNAGADIVIVKYHGGNEYDPMPNAQQVALARALTASPYVDLVAGEHAHVVQPITKVNGNWVVYGMGNAIAQSETGRPRAYEGISVGFTFRETRKGFVVDHAEYVPTYWNHYSSGRPIRIHRVVRALARGIGDQARLRQALLATRTAVGLLGHERGLEQR